MNRISFSRHSKTLPATLLPGALLLGALLLGTGRAAQAQSTFSVSLNTSTLIGSPNNPFFLDFQLTDGSGLNDGNNTATLSNFQFGSGSAFGTATTSGGASGSLASGITLTDSSFSNELFQSFTPGSTLTFDVALTGNPDAGATPDEFSFALLDSTQTEVPTTGDAGAFVVADFTSQGIVPQTFAGTGAYAAIEAPTITSPNPVPEASTTVSFGLLLALGLGGMVIAARKKKAAASA